MKTEEIKRRNIALATYMGWEESVGLNLFPRLA